jgi:hypothetical protein
MKQLAILATIVLIGTLAFTGCTTTSASSTEPLLSAAGFRVKSPETDAQRRIYDQLPAYKIQRGTRDGKVFYAYKNEREGVAYVGGEDEYQKYQTLATQRRIAADNRAAAQMNQDLAYGWYGAWGPVYYPFY